MELEEKSDLTNHSEANCISLNDKDTAFISSQVERTTYEESENTNENKNSTLDIKGEFEPKTNTDSQQINNNEQTLCEDINGSDNIKVSEVVVKTNRPLCADYTSDSDSDSLDSDTSTSTEEITSETSSESDSESNSSEDSSRIKIKEGSEKTKADFSLLDLPPIEELRITVPEDDCIEIGIVTSIIDSLVVVESYKGTPALDVDTVLFLDCGKRTLGKVFDILGPVSEPVYAVRFNSQKQIQDSKIDKGLKVYCAPKSQHTSFVFLSEIMKHKGSDASWKDNIEAPSEFQDFSDDEEEKRHKMDNNSNGDKNGSRKRPFCKTTNIVQPERFRPQNNLPQNNQPQRNRFPNIQQRPFIRPNVHQIPPIQPFHYNVPFYPGNSSLTGGPPLPQVYFPPRFSGPPFPSFGLQGQRFQQPFHQQRTHLFINSWRPQFLVVPPPPPPPSSTPPVGRITGTNGKPSDL